MLFVRYSVKDFSSGCCPCAVGYLYEYSARASGKRPPQYTRLVQTLLCISAPPEQQQGYGEVVGMLMLRAASVLEV